MTEELVDGDMDTPCREFVGFEYLELGFVHKRRLGGAFNLFLSVADHEILETICLADVVELYVLLSFMLEVKD